MKYVHLAKVSSSFKFPIDMLRYDRCWPTSQIGTSEIEESLRWGRSKSWEVEVSTISDSKEPPWTTERWISFQCKIEHIETRRI